MVLSLGQKQGIKYNSKYSKDISQCVFLWQGKIMLMHDGSVTLCG